MQFIALDAAKTDHETMCGTPVFEVLAVFPMTRALTTDVQLVAKDVLIIAQNTLINQMVR